MMKRTLWSMTPLICCGIALLAWQPSASFARDAGGAPAAQDFSSRGHGHGHAKGHARGHGNAHWRSAYAYHGANDPHFCPPGQAKKPGLGSRFRC